MDIFDYLCRGLGRCSGSLKTLICGAKSAVACVKFSFHWGAPPWHGRSPRVDGGIRSQLRKFSFEKRQTMASEKHKIFKGKSCPCSPKKRKFGLRMRCGGVQILLFVRMQQNRFARDTFGNADTVLLVPIVFRQIQWFRKWFAIGHASAFWSIYA